MPGLKTTDADRSMFAPRVVERRDKEGLQAVTLSRRTTIVVGLTLLVLFGGLHAVVSRVLLGGFQRVEHATAILSVERADQAIQLLAATLSMKLSDWASWDDAYAFTGESDEEFIASNLTLMSLENLGLRFMIFLRPDGTVSCARARTATSTEVARELPPGVLEALMTPGVLVEGETSDDERSGIVMTPEGMLLVASRPLLTSLGAGPANGRLVFCQLFDAKTVAAMSARLRHSIEIRPLDSAMSSADRAIVDTVARSGVPTIELVTDYQKRGIGVVRDLRGDPAAAIHVTLPRFVYQEAITSTRLLFGALVIATIASVSVTLLALRLTVLSRLATLHREVALIGSDGNLTRRVTLRGRDELTDLARTVNMLLGRVETSQEELARRADALQAASEELRVARDAAEDSNRAKSEFLANMSHEVRTPMTAILGYSDILAEHISRPKGPSASEYSGDSSTAGVQPVECIDTIRRNARHLLTIINDILDLSKIEAWRLQMEHMECSPLAVGQEVLELLTTGAALKKLTLKLQLAAPVPSKIQTDPTRMRQILLNLVGNAIKFTREGTVTLSMGCDRERGVLVVDVVDTGIGIRPDQASRLFAAFSQADASTSRVFGGTGLGLVISRKLASLLGGALDLHQSSDCGSTFRLQIATGPIADGTTWITRADGMTADPEKRQLAVAVPADNAPLAGMRVLIAEDGPDNQRLLTFIFDKAGGIVTLVADGQAAVDAVVAAQLRQAPFDLVVMDMQMPVLDGYGATRELRTRGYTLPILALTAHAMEGDRNACLAAGCDEYATKPVDRASLLAVCAGCVSRSRGVRNAA